MSAKMNQAGKGSGKRRRYAGKTGIRVKVRGGYVVAMRSHSHGGHSTASNGWSADDTHDPGYGKTGVPSKHLKGEHRVQIPRGRTRYVRGPK